MSNAEPIKVLILEGDKADFEATEQLLLGLKLYQPTVKWIQSFEQALPVLDNESFDICLLASGFHIDHGLAVLREAAMRGFTAPVIILADGQLADYDVEVLRAGAADYLIKGKIKPAFLERSIRYARERKHSQDQQLLLEKQHFTAAKMRSLGLLAAAIAGDLTDNIKEIQTHLQILERLTESMPAAQQAASLALDCCRHTALVTDHLLAYSSQECKLRKNIDLQTLTVETLRFLHRLLPNGIRIASKFDGERIPLISGDPALIRQAIIHLVLNARNALPEGGTIAITLDATETAQPQHPAWNGRVIACARLSVVDNGLGIPPEHLERVFEPTFTSDPSAELGLGLASVFTIMEQHSGWVTASSKLGYGSTFTLYFPLNSAAIPVSTANPEQPLVLVIDDQELMLTLAQLYLEAAGFTTKLFSDPLAALAWYRSQYQHVALVLLDLSWPDTMGREYFDHLRKINSAAGIVICNQEFTDECKVLLDSGAIRFFEKPGRYPLMITWMTEYLGRL